MGRSEGQTPVPRGIGIRSPGGAAGPALIRVAPGAPFLASVAELTLDRLHDPESSLAGVVCIVPHAGLARPLRNHLLAAAQRRSIGALLGPEVLPLGHWVAQTANARAWPAALRTLDLHELLRGFPAHFDQATLWALCTGLLPLLDELHARGGRLEEADLPDAPAGLQRELQTVRAVYDAWSRPPTRGAHPARCTREAFERFAALPEGTSAVFAGCDHLSALEAGLLGELLSAGRGLAFFQYAHEHPNPAVQALAARGVGDTPSRSPAHYALVEQAWAGAAAVADLPAQGAAERWAVVPCADDEAQVQFVAHDITTRTLGGGAPIAVVTEDRKLLRRLRALLELSEVAVDDQAGWALSTTAAATVLARLLDCVERDFHHAPLLEVLKSPFLAPPQSRAHLAARLDAVAEFERRLVREAHLVTGLGDYRAGLDSRAGKALRPASRAAMHELLQQLDSACAGLRRLHETPGGFAVADFLAALRRCLQALGCWHRWCDDEAGAQLVGMLSELETGLQAAPAPRLDWPQARAWLDLGLERRTFSPAGGGVGVQLLNLRATVGLNPGLVYLLGANEDRLPAPDAGVTAFFNDAMRRTLGLRTRHHARRQAQHSLAMLYANAHAVIATYALEADGQALLPARWLTRLATLHELVAGSDLHHPDRPEASVPVARGRADYAVLAAGSERPAPAAPVALLPERVSALAHQRLVECPYRYYVMDCLGLNAAGEVHEGPGPADYGKAVHACLHAFHREPANHRLLRADPGAAAERLAGISRAQFARLGEGYESRAWLARWLQTIPGYIDWQASRAGEHTVAQTEAPVQRRLGGVTLEGRIDRLDRAGEDGLAVLDYKTGKPASRARIESGEDVQIASYALGVGEPVSAVHYVGLDPRGTRTSGISDGPALAGLTAAVGARLEASFAALSEGAPMPAWPGPRCAVCEAKGVCRQPVWRLDVDEG